MAGYGIILTGLLVILYVRKRKREMNPDGAKRKGAQARKRERMLFGITMFFACVLLFYRPRETFSITALDVGQGDALVVESGRFLMLNDGGSSSASAVGEKRILPYLKQRGIAALDAVVITHPDADHTNGILELLELIGSGRPRRGIFEGDLSGGELEIGQEAALVRDLPPAGEVVARTMAEYRERLRSLPEL